jgi:hypothetical protein
LWTPLEEKDDAPEDEDFTNHRISEILLESLVRHADAEGADHGSENIPDTAHNDRHERIDNIVLPQGRADIGDL